MKIAVRKKMVATAAIATSALLVLSGCGSDEGNSNGSNGNSHNAADHGNSDDSGNTASAEDLVPEGEGTTSYPYEIESPWGTSTLEEQPKKIAAVTMSQDDTEILVSMGVTPYIAREPDGEQHPWIADDLKHQIPEAFTATPDNPFPAEQIAAAEPDLIIALGMDLEDYYDQMTAIAPVLAEAGEAGTVYNTQNDWDDNIRRVGEALDLQEAAEDAVSTEEEFFETFRDEHPEYEGKTVAYLVSYGDEGGLQYHSTEGSPAGNTLESMGFELPELASTLEYRDEIAEEQLGTIDADVVIFSANDETQSQRILDNELFKQIKASQDDNVVVITNKGGSFEIDGNEHDGNLSWALARSGPLSATWAASQVAGGLDKVFED